MHHFFTVGTDEVRSWTTKKNITAPKVKIKIIQNKNLIL